MIGRILQSVDFERVLGRPVCARSPHFAVHFLAGCPSRKTQRGVARSGTELSTATDPIADQAVDESGLHGRGIWLGSVVPKRHARRAVTRALLKRQIRHAVDVQAALDGTSDGNKGAARGGLARGLWVVRLRMPFDKQQFPSASSEALRLAAAQELSSVLAQAASRAVA